MALETNRLTVGFVPPSLHGAGDALSARGDVVEMARVQAETERLTQELHNEADSLDLLDESVTDPVELGLWTAGGVVLAEVVRASGLVTAAQGAASLAGAAVAARKLMA